MYRNDLYKRVINKGGDAPCGAMDSPMASPYAPTPNAGRCPATPRSRRVTQFLHILLLLPFLLISTLWISSVSISDANAAPLGFRRPRATFALGIDAFNTFIGDFANYTDVGMRVFAEATMQAGGYFGLNLRFGSARGFTKKDFLPFDNGYQFVYITGGPRFYLAPFRKLNLYFYAQPEIAVNIFMSNTLVKVTGNDSVTGSAGGALGIQYIINVVSISGQISCQYDWVFKTLYLTGGIAVGLTSTFK